MTSKQARNISQSRLVHIKSKSEMESERILEDLPIFVKVKLTLLISWKD